MFKPHCFLFVPLMGFDQKEVLFARQNEIKVSVDGCHSQVGLLQQMFSNQIME